ncbi:MAG TPA: hypothetical protein P5137_07615 [Candidatus Brocadiia bacterium]|nr:hypothetical protein [Candidatus Brocadiia bacterium]
MRIHVSSSVDNGLLLAGAPLAQGVARPDQGWTLRLPTGAPLPLWWAERALWPDGSVKWLWLHSRVPAGEAELTLEPAKDAKPATFAGLSVSADKVEAQASGFRFAACLDGFTLDGGGATLVVEDEGDMFEPAPPKAEGRRFFEVLEDSAIAPLIRLRDESPQGVRREHLFRVDAARGVVVWTRRVSLMSGPRHDLRRMSASLSLARGVWRLAAAPGSRALMAPRPHCLTLDGGAERRGNPEALLETDGAAALLVKGWQRAPFGMEVNGRAARLAFYPESAPALPVLQGTSFRHVTRLALGMEAAASARAETRWRWDASAASSGAMGPLAPRDEDVKRYYPGFDRAFESAILHCRPTRLDKPGGMEPPGPVGDLGDETTHDEEFFGLHHYGDWPMTVGAYGGKRRMYVDNEYDVAYALFQHFARTGRWEIYDLARHSAIHMTDVDYMAHAADMRFHGYMEYAENHADARAGGDGGHYWTDGYWLLHFIEGDPWARENALALTSRIVKMYDGGEDAVRAAFTGCERVLGWCMVAMCGTAENTPAPEAVATMERMSQYVAKYMRDPDAEFDGVDAIGGKPAKWWRAAAQDGCKPFMLGVLMEGLERYHRLSGSAAAKEALAAIACFLRDVMWSPTAAAFEYERNAYNQRHREVYPTVSTCW